MKRSICLLIVFTIIAVSSTAKAVTTLSNDYIEIAVSDTDGRFTIGKPNDGAILLFGHPSPWSSYTSIRIDGADYTNNGQPFGTLTTAPANSGTVNTTVFSLNNLEITQSLSLVESWSSGNADWVMIKYSIKNNDSVSHDVGVRVMLDTMLGNNDGSPFRVPGTGAVTYEREYNSAAMPAYFLSFDDLTNPTVISQGTLQGNLAVKPDLFQLAAWPNLYGTDWSYTVDANDLVTSDSAVAVYWNPVTIAAGATRNFVTYYGIGNISLDTAAPMTVGLSAPAELSIVDKALSPSPFTIFAFLENSVDGISETLTGITAELTLPFGLELAAGETAAKTAADLAVGENTQLAWNVNGTGIANGNLSYTVTVAVTNAGISPCSKEVSKYVNLPGSVTGLAPSQGDASISLNWTNLDMSALTWNNLTQSTWTGTLVLRREDSQPATLPADGTSYSAGDTIGSAAVVYAGNADYSSTALIDTGLTNGARYYYTAFTYDDVTAYIPAGASIFAAPQEPDTTAPAGVSNFTVTAGSGQVSLSWSNPSINDHPDFEGVKILRRTDQYPLSPSDSDAFYIYDGTGTSWTDTLGITNGATYYYTAYSYDEVPNYSSASRDTATPLLASSGSDGGGGGGGCFVAAAAYGTPLAEEVRILSEFRDKYLLTNKTGRKFVRFYYQYGPGWAEYIKDKPLLKGGVRFILKPCVWCAEKIQTKIERGKDLK